MKTLHIYKNLINNNLQTTLQTIELNILDSLIQNNAKRKFGNKIPTLRIALHINIKDIFTESSYNQANSDNEVILYLYIVPLRIDKYNVTSFPFYNGTNRLPFDSVNKLKKVASNTYKLVN